MLQSVALLKCTKGLVSYERVSCGIGVRGDPGSISACLLVARCGDRVRLRSGPDRVGVHRLRGCRWGWVVILRDEHRCDLRPSRRGGRRRIAMAARRGTRGAMGSRTSAEGSDDRPPGAKLLPSALSSSSASLRLGRDHRHLAVLVDRHDVSVGAARPKPTQNRLLLDDDRVGIGMRLDFEALFKLGLQERVESVLPSTRRIDLSSHHAFPDALTRFS